VKKRNKIFIGSLGLIATAFFASSCTGNFCTDEEKARIAYALEPGVSRYVVNDAAPAERKVGNIELVIDTNEDGTYKNSARLNSIIASAKENKIAVPSTEYFIELDKKVLTYSIAAYNADAKNASAQFDASAPDSEILNTIIEDYGFVKFCYGGSAYSNFYKINEEIKSEHNSYSWGISKDFEKYYINTLNTTVDSYRSCITTYSLVKYGNYDGKQISLEKVSWKAAWDKGGHVIEGLIVYPVALLIDTFALLFAGGKTASTAAIQESYLTGVPQILSIIVVTVIVRLFIFLVTFKSTLAQKKMTELQPELAKIQQKYPNANTNQTQKQRVAEEQMRLYKKNKVNPLSQLLVLIIQFPVFIGVWGAMTGSAVLSTGEFKGLHLSDSIWATLKVGPKNAAGWWAAFILIILMSLSQFFSMKVPQWIQKAKTNKVARLSKNPAQKQQNRTANIVSYVMLIMIIFMGFTLPAAMGVYWFIGAIVSLIQTLFTTVIFAGNKKKK